jgi:hypothetical protein
MTTPLVADLDSMQRLDPETAACGVVQNVARPRTMEDASDPV